MRFYRIVTITGTLLLCLAVVTANGERIEENWPSWRGPNADGVSVAGDPPVRWSESENIKWKVALPFSGDGTPIIWGNRIFIQTAVPHSGEKTDKPAATDLYTFTLVCLDRETGKRVWERAVAEVSLHEGHHPQPV